MSQPNPWILFMGGIAMLNVSMLVGGLHAPAWARYGGMAVCVVLGVVSMGLGLHRQFQKKPERPRFVPRRKRTSVHDGAAAGDPRPQPRSPAKASGEPRS